MVRGDPPALSAMVMAAVSAPTDAGVNCPWITQLAPAAKLDPQGFGNANDEALAPVTPMLAMDRDALPVLVRVTCCDALSVPSAWAPNHSRDVDSDARGESPLSEMLCVA